MMGNQKSGSNDEAERASGLRREGIPLKWTELTHQQQEACEQVARHLNDACSRLGTRSKRNDDRPSRQTPFFLDRERSSQVVLLNGDRGTGKTSVMLTLMDLTIRDDWAVESKAFGTWRQIRSRLIWLEPLDMEPHPRGSNLLASILARIEDAVFRFAPGLEPNECGGRPASFFDATEARKPLLELNRLMGDAALTWDGNLPERASAIDPDPFAREVLRAEKARLGLNSRLSGVLEQLSRHCFRDPDVRDPLFVVPVDDVDLSPLHVLELLRLVRMISVPRLFFLILGSEELIEKVLYWKWSGDLGGLVEHSASSAFKEESEDLWSTARMVSSDAFRKLIPPAQRIKLGAMTPEEALAFHPDRNESTLRAVLASISLLGETGAESAILRANGEDIKTLDEFLTIGRNPGQRTTKDSDFVCKTIGILRTAPRKIQDLYFQLVQVNTNEPGKRHRTLIGLACNTFSSFVNEDPFLMNRDRELLKRVVRKDEATARWKFGWDEVSFSLNLEGASQVPSAKATWFKEEGSEYQGHMLGDPDVSVLFAFPQELRVEDGSAKEWRPLKMLGSTRYAMFLAHDLIASAENDWEHYVFDLHDADELVGVELKFPLGDKDGQGKRKVEIKVRVPWHMPIWQSFWELDQFIDLWNRTISKRDLEDLPLIDRVLRLSYLFVSMASSIVWGDKFQDWLPDPHKTEWPRLIDLIEKKASNRGTSSTWYSNRANDWLVRIAAMMAPESGLPWKEADPTRDDSNQPLCVPALFLSKSEIRGILLEYREELKSLRSLTLDLFETAGLREVGNEMIARGDEGSKTGIWATHPIRKSWPEILFSPPPRPNPRNMPNQASKRRKSAKEDPQDAG